MRKSDMWWQELGCCCENGAVLGSNGKRYVAPDGVWMTEQALSASQAQTGDVFAYKWHKEDTFTSSAALEKTRRWLTERYGDVAPCLVGKNGPPLVLDAGCGAAMSALELFGPHFPAIRYIGVDVSAAVQVARKRVTAAGHEGLFLQESLMNLPFAPGTVDVIFSEGVLHHTDDTRAAFNALTPLLRPGGCFMFYVYKKKGPIREFTDDYIREKLQAMTPEEAWEAMRPLTRLGVALGDLDIEIDVPEAIPLLDIPAGRISLQRFMYWNVFKAFYDQDKTEEELNHINFDWYAPCNAHRHTPEEVRSWCEDNGLKVQRMQVENAGITVVAKQRSAACV